MFLVFTSHHQSLIGQNIVNSEVNILSEIERRIAELTEETVNARRERNSRALERIMLRISSTGMLALSRNEIFGESQLIFQNDDVEEEMLRRSGRSQYVPTVGLGENLFTVPTSYLLQVPTARSKPFNIL